MVGGDLLEEVYLRILLQSGEALGVSGELLEARAQAENPVGLTKLPLDEGACGRATPPPLAPHGHWRGHRSGRTEGRTLRHLDL